MEGCLVDEGLQLECFIKYPWIYPTTLLPVNEKEHAGETVVTVVAISVVTVAVCSTTGLPGSAQMSQLEFPALYILVLYRASVVGVLNTWTRPTPTCQSRNLGHPS